MVPNSATRSMEIPARPDRAGADSPSASAVASSLTPDGGGKGAEAAPPAVGVVVAVAVISAGGTPPERSTDSKTFAWSPCTVASSSVRGVDEPLSPAARFRKRAASRCARSRACSSGICWRTGRSVLRGASPSSRTRHPDSAVMDPTVSATKSDLRDQTHGIRSFACMGSMMARRRAVAVSTTLAPIH